MQNTKMFKPFLTKMCIFKCGQLLPWILQTFTKKILNVQQDIPGILKESSVDVKKYPELRDYVFSSKSINLT